MKDKWITAGLAGAVCFCFLPAWPQQANTVETAPREEPAFQDEPAAHELYREMIQAMRKATSSYGRRADRWGQAADPATGPLSGSH
jgi:hypothetical protein